MSLHSDAVKLREDDSKISYADAHCHLVPDFFTMEEVKEIVIASSKKNVDVIVNSATDPNHYEFGLETADLDSIFLTIGIEPTKITNKKMNEFTNFFKEHESSIVAIGEVGLDFHWIKEIEQRTEQEKFFNTLIDFAQENDKPIVVHSRGAEARAIEILKQKGVEDVLMHCFSGTEEQTREISKLSWYVTVPTSTIYRKNFQRILNSVSLDSLMFETDSPFHSLEKDQKNDPSSIPTLCRNAARILEIEEKDLAEITYNNTRTFYRI
ncbi:MAG: TatD family hydrolase [Candidatus Heimdallarchaeaceae archaeon]